MKTFITLLLLNALSVVVLTQEVYSTRVQFNPLQNVAGIAKGRAATVIMGTFGQVIQTTDFTDWTTSQLNPDGLIVHDLEYFKDQYTAVGLRRNLDSGQEGFVMESLDGIEWRTTPINFPILRLSQPTEGSLYGMDNEGGLFHSNDGQIWSEIISGEGDSSIHEICKVGDLYLAVGMGRNDDHGYLLSSLDGVTWKENPDVFQNGLVDIVHHAGVTLITTGSPTIFRSTDLAHWDKINVTNVGLLYAEVFQGAFYLAGFQGALVKSSDGIQWEKTPFTAPAHFSKLHASETGLIGGWEGHPNNITVSRNGIDWQTIFSAHEVELNWVKDLEKIGLKVRSASGSKVRIEVSENFQDWRTVHQGENKGLISLIEEWRRNAKVVFYRITTHW